MSPLSTVLNRASRSARTRRAVESFPLTRRVVDRFVAGETTADALAATGRLVAAGRRVTLDVLGEDVHDLAGALQTRDAYLDLLEALARAGHAAGADLSLKLSALGQALPDGAAIATDHAAQVCMAAAAHGCTVTLDMEDHSTVDSTLAIGAELRADHPWVGNVLQTNLRRTPGDIAALARAGVRIRLVKGAYREPVSVAWPGKADVDRAYAEAIEALMAADCYPMIATHDEALVEHALRAAAHAGRGDADWEAQLLHGVRPALEQRLLDTGHQVRVYVPFGTDWYGYFMRRLAERPANVAFFLRALAHR